MILAYDNGVLRWYTPYEWQNENTAQWVVIYYGLPVNVDSWSRVIIRAHK